MILANENVDHAIIEALIEKGIEVYSIYAMQRGLSDEEIITLSRNPPRIILTEDKDFGEWVFAHKESAISVIFASLRFYQSCKHCFYRNTPGFRAWPRTVR